MASIYVNPALLAASVRLQVRLGKNSNGVLDRRTLRPLIKIIAPSYQLSKLVIERRVRPEDLENIENELPNEVRLRSVISEGQMARMTLLFALNSAGIQLVDGKIKKTNKVAEALALAGFRDQLGPKDLFGLRSFLNDFDSISRQDLFFGLGERDKMQIAAVASRDFKVLYRETIVPWLKVMR